MRRSLPNYRHWVFPVHLRIGSTATFLNGCNVSGWELRPQACRVSHMESHRVQSWDPPCLLSTSTTFLLYQTCSLESYVDDSELYLSFPSNMIQQINNDFKKNRKLVLLKQPSRKPRENQAAGVGHTSDVTEAAR